MIYSRLWRFVYVTYPPLLRLLERIGFHTGRQPFRIGVLNKKYTLDDFRRHLETRGFEHAILAWKDSDEALSMRKVHGYSFQWHIRLHSDGEIRGHYEYSPEGNPFGHIFCTVFRLESEFFLSLLGDYVVVSSRP